MTIKETNLFMERIKQHYQEFIIDDLKIEEWHNELQKYDFKDVNEKLDEHLRSEQYGTNIPKLYFLTKYLKTEEEKKQNRTYYTKCQLCQKKVNLAEYDKHYEKCSSIEYLIRTAKKHYNKIVTREYLENLSEYEFEKKYWEIVTNVSNKNDISEMEIKSITNALLTHKGKNAQITLNEILK